MAIFIQQSPDFQFLSVCHYITTFGIIFNNKDLITLNERNQSIPVLNTLFEHLHESKNESETKLQLLKIVLQGTDLCGGGDNETLDMKYVNETYQYIISEVLFSHYGNINGYLAKIINQADNVNYFALRKKVIHKLHKNYITRDYCSPSNETTKLTKLAIRKVFEDHIWSIFPQPEQDMSIMDVNYIYAMVGLKIVRSVAKEMVDLKFYEYILISREIDLQQFNNETYEMALKLFSTPALFFYAFKLKDKYRKMEELRTRNQFILNDEFWSEAYENLFSYISNSVDKTVNEGIGNNLYSQLDKEIHNLKSRTLIAYEILKVFCCYDNVAQVSELLVGLYKTFYHWITKLVLPNRCRKYELPELEQVYNDQFDEVAKIYNQIETNAIEKVINDGELIEELNPNAIVLIARLPDYHQGCNLCSPPPRSKNKDIYLLFAIKEKKTNFYALKQENNTLTLLRSNGNERGFAKAVSNYTSLKMEIAKNAVTLKYLREDYKMFVQRVAEMKTQQFVNGLKKYYYDETLGEKYLNFFKSLIPFYNCIESAKSGDVSEAVLSCTIDVVSLLPIAGFSVKYTTQLGRSLAKEIGNRYLITNSLARAGMITKLPIITVLKQITKTAVTTVAKEILTTGFLKDFAVASLRSVDPGFELFYQVSNFGFKTFRKLFRNIIANFKAIPSVANTLGIIKSLLKIVKRNMNLIPDITGLVPMVLVEQNGHNIVRYLYPGGSNPFGPTCLTSYGRTAELRSIEGYPFEIAVMPVKSPGDVTYYKQYIPETGRILDTKLKMGGNDILRRVGYLLDNMFADGHDINLFRNYDVYHNTINWNKPPAKIEATENFNRPVGSYNSMVESTYQEVPQSLDNTRTLQEHLGGSNAIYNPHLFNSDFQVSPTGNVAGNSVYQSEILPGNLDELTGNVEGNVDNLLGDVTGSLDHLQALRENLFENNVQKTMESEAAGTLEGFATIDNDFSENTNAKLLQSLEEYLVFRQNAPRLSDPVPEVIDKPNFLPFLESERPTTSKRKANTDLKTADAKLSSFFDRQSSYGENSVLFPNSDHSLNLDYTFPQLSNSKLPETSISIPKEAHPLEPINPNRKHSSILKIPSSSKDKKLLSSSAEDSGIPQKISRVYDLYEGPGSSVQYVTEILDDLRETMKQFLVQPNPEFYRAIMTESVYKSYVGILLIFKKYGLPFLKQDKVKLNFLRASLNNLALFQLHEVFPIQNPSVLWCTKIVINQKQIDFLRNLKGKNFFFNDITLLTDKSPGSYVRKNLNSLFEQTQIRYRLTFDSPYGFIDLTHFHKNFENNYIVFNDLLFTVMKTNFIKDRNIFIVELKSQGISKEVWQYSREQDISNFLEDGRTIVTPRMKSIANAANFIADNAPLCTFKASKEFLNTYILSTNPTSTSSVPTYNMFAEDFRNMQFRSFYDYWRIKPHPYIQDVLLDFNLDRIIDLSEAKRRIEQIYGLVYDQNIPEAFRKYRKMIGVAQHLRFEDYYVLYSFANGKLLRSKETIRRFEAAVNRLGLRQCAEEWIVKPILLYRGEMISQEISAMIQSFRKDHVIVFDQLKIFTPQQMLELNILNEPSTSSKIPLLIEIVLYNQAGVADVGRILKNENPIHVMTSDFKFTVDDVLWRKINGRDVLVMRMHDFENPTENRMVMMARKLYELFSTETKFYSDVVENSV